MVIKKCDRCGRMEDDGSLPKLEITHISYWFEMDNHRPNELRNDLCNDCLSLLVEFYSGKAVPSLADQTFPVRSVGASDKLSQ